MPRLQVSVSETFLSRIKEQAKLEGHKVSQLVRTAIELYLKGAEK